MIKIFTSTSKE